MQVYPFAVGHVDETDGTGVGQAFFWLRQHFFAIGTFNHFFTVFAGDGLGVSSAITRPFESINLSPTHLGAVGKAYIDSLEKVLW
jgi:hypothetical protein